MTRNHQGIGMTSQRTRDRLVQRLQQQGINQKQVLHQMRQIPRHLFVDEALAQRAYEDTALPIGYGQTISQPYIVAHMTESLGLTGKEQLHKKAILTVLNSLFLLFEDPVVSFIVVFKTKIML